MQTLVSRTASDCGCVSRVGTRIWHVGMVLGVLPPKRSTPVYSSQEYSPPTFRFVARYARVRIVDSSRNNFASTAYFAQSQTTLIACIFFMGGIVCGGK